MMGLKIRVGKFGSSPSGMAEERKDSRVLLPNPLPGADTSHALLQILLILPVFGTTGYLFCSSSCVGFPLTPQHLHLAHVVYLSHHGLLPAS